MVLLVTITQGAPTQQQQPNHQQQIHHHTRRHQADWIENINNNNNNENEMPWTSPCGVNVVLRGSRSMESDETLGKNAGEHPKRHRNVSFK